MLDFDPFSNQWQNNVNLKWPIREKELLRLTVSSFDQNKRSCRIKRLALLLEFHIRRLQKAILFYKMAFFLLVQTRWNMIKRRPRSKLNWNCTRFNFWRPSSCPILYKGGKNVKCVPLYVLWIIFYFCFWPVYADILSVLFFKNSAKCCMMYWVGQDI